MMRIVSLALALSLLAAPAFAASADMLLTRSRSAQLHGDMDAAIRLAQSAIVADPARAASYVALGDLYAREKEAQYAAYYYAEALSIDPTEPDAQKGLALAERDAPQAAAARSLDKQ